MNALIIGLGSIAMKHISAIRSIDSKIKIYALRSKRSNENIAGVINIFSYEEINFDPSFIIISNPTSEHYKTIEKAIQFKCPIFIEKPSLDNLENADNLLRQVQKKGILAYVGCNLRFLPSIQFVKSYMETNRPRVNEINAYCGSYLPEWRPGKNYKDLYSARKEMGGGVHLDLIHELDYIYWIFGNPSNSMRIVRSSSSLEISAMDYANYSLIYSDFVASVVLNYYRNDAKRTLEILLENGTLSVNLLKNSVDLNKERLFESSFMIADTYKEQMKYFITCIANGGKTMNDLKNSIDVLKICLGNE